MFSVKIQEDLPHVICFNYCIALLNHNKSRNNEKKVNPTLKCFSQRMESWESVINDASGVVHASRDKWEQPTNLAVLNGI